MRVIDDVYTYDIKEKKVRRILKRIDNSKPVKKLYVIVLPLFNDGILEIYSYNQLLQPYYKKRTDDIEIVGMSKGRAGADRIVLGLIQEMCDEGCTDFENMGRDIRKFVE
jgi:hypothetical protein